MSIWESQEESSYLKANEKLHDEITITKPKIVELTKSDIFETTKKVLLSSNTVQSHIHRDTITAYDYALILEVLKGEKRVFQQKENVYVLLKKLAKNYRLSLKNILNNDEIFVTSLLFVKDIEKETYKLRRFKEVVQE